MSLPSESQASSNEARSTTVHRSLSERRHENPHAARRDSSGAEDHTTWTQFLREDQNQLMDSGSTRGDDNSLTRKRRIGSGSGRGGGGGGVGGGSSSGMEISGARGTQPVSIRQHSRPGAAGARLLGNSSFIRQDEEETTETQPAASPPSSSMSRQLNSLRHRERSFTDHRLPRWQPDAEVTECPICGVTFTFWFRKHHCRKCGRVVCAACSPHRITIPQQFIVRPPEAQTQMTLSSIIQRGTTDREVVSFIDNEEVRPQLSPSQSRSHHRATSIHQIPRNALGGGSEVRLCNPCVPDPNPEPPRRYRASSSTSHHEHRARNTSLGWEDHHRSPGDPHSLPSEYQSSSVWSASAERPRRQVPSTPFHLEGRRQRNQEFESSVRGYRRDSQRAHRTSLTEANLPSYGGFGYEVSSSLRGLVPRYLPGREGESQIQGSPPSSFPDVFTGLQRNQHHPSYSRSTLRTSDMNRPLPAPPSASRSRPTIAERDICPVCNRIFPPQAPGRDEDAREAHIRVCIERHASRRPGASNQSPQTSINTPSERLRMLTFLATEKDCLGTDGILHECSICMEEYEVGAELARLECLCKFHKSCILGWFDRKEECPVHKVT
ncbi:FYVE zinc finger protein [Nannizzia gypsea CBS 118893]|uniref:RING-type E3 ubiquitin transferase n=1 Tax=Arthroderma gypseum (strain ATCC MYA-4604 / CBS 118893) TaxID=535722 RepID=E4UP28_ARTGP|nr:FYVE zinc finger protein [Nannizzia gypsea CBS 118893]EFQ99781.1 FYVE zinc finger protein [Nannizzia gypsea CBS 118893]